MESPNMTNWSKRRLSDGVAWCTSASDAKGTRSPRDGDAYHYGVFPEGQKLLVQERSSRCSRQIDREEDSKQGCKQQLELVLGKGGLFKFGRTGRGQIVFGHVKSAARNLS